MLNCQSLFNHEHLLLDVARVIHLFLRLNRVFKSPSGKVNVVNNCKQSLRCYAWQTRMVRPWVGWLCILFFISMVFYLYLSINAPIIRNPYFVPKNLNLPNTKGFQKNTDMIKGNMPLLSHEKDCTTIHIAMVCAGFNSTVALATTVKSILFYRTRPLHFHLMVDEISLKILSVLFTSWKLPHVVVSFYKTEEWVPKVSWIPNKHYSGVYGLLKLVLPDAIPEKNLIVLDTDVTILNDISLLWKLFEQFNGEQVLGLVENQSDWYVKSTVYNVRPWPALGRGYNTGIMLMDLHRLRAKNFSKLWENTTLYVLKDIFETSLADQDIINAVIKNNTNFVFTINCAWNVQLSDHALSESCYNSTNQINVIHWNSPRKFNVRNKHAQDFKRMHQVFLELDGNLLRRRLFACNRNEEPNQHNEMDPCIKFKEGAKIVYRTHPFFLEFENNVISSADVLLATQCSIDRIVLLEDMSKHWPGVISIALYLTDNEVQTFLDFVHNSVELRSRKNIAYHIVYKEGDFYPVNYLRNVAMKYTSLPYVFQLDIDFLPQFGLHKNLIDYIIANNITEYHRTALVIPAFETQRYRFSFPSTKAELLKYLDYRILYTFRYHVWSQGHAPTNFTFYRNATEPYEVTWEPDFEPYIVVPKSAPSYDERFIGFGWNKVSYITHLTALGYKYVVLPDTFIIHRPHAPSRDIGKFRTDASYRRCLKWLKDSFVQDLLDKLGDKAVTNLNKIFVKQIKGTQNVPS